MRVIRIFVALAALAAGALAMPARADVPGLALELATEAGTTPVCEPMPVANPGSESSMICIHTDGAHGRYGSIRYQVLSSTGRYYANATVYVQRCQTRERNCTTVAANMKGAWTDENGSFVVRTSAKPESYGWIYRACGSLKIDETETEWVDQCSDFMAHGAP